MDILSDSLWTLSYLGDTQKDDIIGRIAKQQNVARICHCLSEKDITIYVPALRTIGNILTSNDHNVVDLCLWEGCLDRLTNILYTTNSNLIKETLWALSNISAGNQSQVEKFVESAAFERVLALAMSHNIDHRRESLFVLSNAITGCDPIYRKQILEKGGDLMIAALVKGLYMQDLRILRAIMEAIDALLKLDIFYDWR